jgi:hypothetical protein
MDTQYYKFVVSPENIKGDLISVPFTGETDIKILIDPCCPITAETITTITGNTGYYLPMREVLSGGTDGNSILTGLSVNLLLIQNTVDIGYYSVFDGAILQKEVLTNFLFSADTITDPLGYSYYFYNTSDIEFAKFLQQSTYVIDWGDGSPQQPITSPLPVFHQYPSGNNVYTITLTSYSPWGISYVEKDVVVPFTGTTIPNPNGTAFFVPAGGGWSATPISYDYIFTGDSNTNINDFYSYNYTTIPFLITGYTESSISELIQYGPVSSLIGGKYVYGPVTGNTGQVGEFIGPDPSGIYTAYTLGNITYYDYEDFTIYVVESSGFTQNDLILSAITKNEALLNVVDELQVLSNVYVERGVYAPLESVMRLGEVDSVGDLEKYGYGFFNVEKIAT